MSLRNLHAFHTRKGTGIPFPPKPPACQHQSRPEMGACTRARTTFGKSPSVMPAKAGIHACREDLPIRRLAFPGRTMPAALFSLPLTRGGLGWGSSRPPSEDIHSLATRCRGRLMLAMIAIMTVGCATQSASQPGQDDLPRLRDVYAHDFRIGVAFSHGLLDAGDTAALALAGTQFNAFTPENEMKWSSIHPKETAYNYGPADALVAFAEQHRMGVTGHTLVWHQQTPDWVFQDADGKPATRETVLLRLREHIRAILGHYRGRVRGWDVVNEAISPEKDAWLRNSPWLLALGEDYVEQAFRLAREGDPDAELYYNDYNLEEPEKREKAVRLIKRLQERGVRVDGIGLQGHFTLKSVNVEELAKTIETFSAMGLRVNISELDMRLYTYGDLENRYPNGAPAELTAEQSEKYAALFKVFVAHRDVIDRVTFWGVHDGLSWTNSEPVKNRPDYSLLFDRECRPKPAFYAVVNR
jgi:endo-1,4-beta-xylanase